MYGEDKTPSGASSSDMRQPRKSEMHANFAASFAAMDRLVVICRSERSNSYRTLPPISENASKHENGTPYTASTGRVTAHHRDAAIAEFNRRLRNGEEDIEVLIARRVSSRIWRNNFTVDCLRGIFIEARYAISGRTVDVYLTKVQGDAGSLAAAQVNVQLGHYADAHENVVRVDGGNMELVFPETHQRVLRRPDSAFRPRISSGGEDPSRPRLIIEVELLNKSLAGCDRYCREYFELIPQLRAVLLLKGFRCLAIGGRFACVAVLYRLNDGGEVFVADMVSFVRAALDAGATDVVGPPTLRVLPLAPVRAEEGVNVLENPWRDDACAFVWIPAADILSNAIRPNTGEPVDPERFEDLVIRSTQIWAPWARVFRKPLNWQLLLFPKPQDIHSIWKRNQKGLLLLWKVQTAIVFHATWRLRNDIHFRQTEAQIPNVPNMQMSFKMHYQFIYQHATDLHCDRSTIEMLIQQLGFDPPRDVLPERVYNIWIPRL